MRGAQSEAMVQQELEALTDGRHWRDERQQDNQPDKRHERGPMRGSSALRVQRHRWTGGSGVTRGDTTHRQGGQEVSTPEKNRGTTRGGGMTRSGQVEAPPDEKWWRDKKLRRWRTALNIT